MPPDVSHSRRTQSLLLISKLLDGRDNASPFTFVIDSLEQSAKPVIREYLRRAKIARTNTIFISFETVQPLKNIDRFIRAHDLSPLALQQELKPLLSQTSSKNLLILDTLHPLLQSTSNIPTYLSTLLTPTTSLLAIYHSPQPLSYSSPPPSHPQPQNQNQTHNPYLPPPLTLLKYLATTILTTHSLSHILAQKAARDRSLAAPAFGLEEDEEGVVQGLGANDARGTVVQCEMRRKSGREVELWFVLPGSSPSHNETTTRATVQQKGLGTGGIVLLDDHPLYRRATVEEGRSGDDAAGGLGDVSFNLGLTEKQRRDREGVVMPYYDAQMEGGGSEGGRILYDMGVEDDFDEEEDEI